MVTSPTLLNTLHKVWSIQYFFQALPQTGQCRLTFTGDWILLTVCQNRLTGVQNLSGSGQGGLKIGFPRKQLTKQPGGHFLDARVFQGRRVKNPTFFVG
jgi:hypothetical protein